MDLFSLKEFDPEREFIFRYWEFYYWINFKFPNELY